MIMNVQVDSHNTYSNSRLGEAAKMSFDSSSEINSRLITPSAIALYPVGP